MTQPEIDNLLKLYGRRIAKLRKIRYPGDNQGDFAARLGCSRKTLSRMENGHRGIDFGLYINASIILAAPTGFSDLFDPDSISASIATKDRLRDLLSKKFATKGQSTK